MRQVAQSVSMSLCRSSMGKDGLEKTIALLLAVHSFSAWPVGRSIVQHPGPQHRGPVKNDEAYNARMASLYREVVLKEKPAQSQDGFIPLGALAKPSGNGNGAHAPKPEVEPVAGD